MSMEDKISAEYFFTADKALSGCPMLPCLKTLTICVLITKNGVMVTGENAPASPETFNSDLGFKFAREQAMQKLLAVTLTGTAT